MNSSVLHKRLAGFLGVGLLLWFLVGVILYPAMKTAELSLTDGGAFSLIHYSSFFTTKTSFLPLVNTLVVGIFSVAFCGVVGTALAFFVNFFAFPGRQMVDKLLPILNIVLFSLVKSETLMVKIFPTAFTWENYL